MSGQAELGELGEDREILSCLAFPCALLKIVDGIPSDDTTTLAEVFNSVLQMTESDLLHSTGTPEQVQLRMTAYLLCKAHNLRERGYNDKNARQTLVNLALQCEQVTYQGTRKRQ